MKSNLKFILLLFAMFLVSCNNTDKSLLKILPNDLNTISHILKYLVLLYVQMALIRLLFSLIFGIKININLILLILFTYIYFTHNYGFLELFFITFLPNLIYLIFLYIKKLYGK